MNYEINSEEIIISKDFWTEEYDCFQEVDNETALLFHNTNTNKQLATPYEKLVKIIVTFSIFLLSFPSIGIASTRKNNISEIVSMKNRNDKTITCLMDEDIEELEIANEYNCMKNKRLILEFHVPKKFEIPENLNDDKLFLNFLFNNIRNEKINSLLEKNRQLKKLNTSFDFKNYLVKNSYLKGGYNADGNFTMDNSKNFQIVIKNRNQKRNFQLELKQFLIKLYKKLIELLLSLIILIKKNPLKIFVLLFLIYNRNYIFSLLQFIFFGISTAIEDIKEEYFPVYNENEEIIFYENEIEHLDNTNWDEQELFFINKLKELYKEEIEKELKEQERLKNKKNKTKEKRKNNNEEEEIIDLDKL